jgi:hypothetical protein
VWEFDGLNLFKAGDSLRSFLFTLKNPHNMPAKRFVLMEREKQKAISCDSESGPLFGNDIHISEDCNANTSSIAALGHYYTNDTGLDWRIVLTGSLNFRVKEIEVFEITA